MTKIKFCGLSRICDIEAANELKPDYIGFVFVPTSRRYVSPKEAYKLRKVLSTEIMAVGVFVNEEIKSILDLSNENIMDIIQLHGDENNEYIDELKSCCKKPVIKAVRVVSEKDIEFAQTCNADFILLDSGQGSGKVFDWQLLKKIKRPYFLAGGLNTENIKQALETLRPYGIDVSSGIETKGLKDKEKMTAFISAVGKDKRK